MRNRFIIVFLFALLFAGEALFAFGKKQVEEEVIPINQEWSLCITAFDVSKMSPSWQTGGDTLTRNLATAVQDLYFRFRGEEESLDYQQYALAASRSKAASSIQQKRTERDLLLYKGEPAWKYEKELLNLDEAILKLEENYKLIDESPPVVEQMPRLKLIQANINGQFPEAPEKGGEYRFCNTQKADAFLVGTLSEYYDRVYLDIKLYTRFTRSFSYEDSLLFSPEDFREISTEVSNRLVFAVSELTPSAVIVHTTPTDAMVMIDETYMGQGEIERRIRSPGETEIIARADRHIPASIPLELVTGEISEVFVDLTPLGLNKYEIDAPQRPGSKVFLGSLYMGETPMTLELPSSEYSYVSIETSAGEVGSAILRGNTVVKGSPNFTKINDESGKVDFVTLFPGLNEQKRVEKTRRGFYGIYGAFWIALPASLLVSGIAGTYIASKDYASSTGMTVSDKVSSLATAGNIAKMATYGVIGGTLAAVLFQAFRYIKASGGEAAPIFKAPPKRSEDEIP